MADFAFRSRAKSRKRAILCFVGRRRAVFAVFFISSADDSQFLSFSVFRRPTTSCFCCFFRFVGRRQTIFTVFCISSPDDGRFFPFSDKKMRFFCSQRLILPKNCDFSAPNDSFYQKITIFLLPTANSVKKSRFLASRWLFLSPLVSRCRKARAQGGKIDPR